ncbi:MAG TPA: NYN domain-containing protein [Candidatus Binatia bacterium]
MVDERKILAVFVDFENLALGFKAGERFDIERVLARLVEKGDIVVKRAYADWKRFADFRTQLHEAAFELIEIPGRGISGKNSADIRLCVDAMDLCNSKPHINTFVIVSGDSDFSPLVSKLKENGKHVIGLGTEASTSDLLRDNCHEFIYYEDLAAVVEEPAELPAANEKQRKAFALLLESLQALRRENRDVLWSSLIKETIKRKRPSFNEAFYGYKTFGKLLEDAARRGLLELTRDAQNRSYIVTRFGPEMSTRPAESAERAERTERAPEPEAAKAESAKPAAKKASRSPRSSRRRSRSSSPAATPAS